MFVFLSFSKFSAPDSDFKVYISVNPWKSRHFSIDSPSYEASRSQPLAWVDIPEVTWSIKKMQVIYFVYGLKNSVQICIWLALVLLTGVPHLRETDILPQGGKSGWAGPPSSRIGPWFKLLNTIAEAQNLIPEFEVLYNWVITHHQEDISCNNLGCDQLLQHALLYVESVWGDWGVRYDTSDKRCFQFARKELPMMILIRSELPKTYLITYIRERERVVETTLRRSGFLEAFLWQL